MNGMWMTYCIIAVLLLISELVYFKIADHFNIIDKPNERSSHNRVVLRGGGIIFTIALWIWSIWNGFPEPWLLAAVTLAAGISFVDDIHSLPDSLRLVVQFAAMTMILYPVCIGTQYPLWIQIAILIAALIVTVGCTNIFNFMDGINGITGGYALAMVIPLFLLNRKYAFMEESLLVVMGLSLVVFSFFNFRTKARCFAGDVGSIGIALILVFGVCSLMQKTGDASWLLLFILYGVDGTMTMAHRVMLHEHLGEAHRKHAFQLMANELKMPHVVVSTIYMLLQLAVSLVGIYLIPDSIVAHWMYFAAVAIVMGLGYICFMKKYYHLHEEYLASLK